MSRRHSLPQALSCALFTALLCVLLSVPVYGADNRDNKADDEATKNLGNAPKKIPTPKIHIRSEGSKQYPQFSEGIDYDPRSPDVPDELKELIDLIGPWYPMLRELLWTDEQLSTDEIIYIYLRDKPNKENRGEKALNKEHFDPLAITTPNNELIIYDRYLKKIREGAEGLYSGKAVSGGVIIHELTHMIQARFRVHDRRPRWVSEALAEYHRFSLFEAYVLESFLKRTREDMVDNVIQDRFTARMCKRSFNCPTFLNSGYKFHYQPIHAAGMLVMIEHDHQGIVKKLHRELFNSVAKGYDFFDKEINDFFLRETKKDLEKHWCEYIALVRGKTKQEACEFCSPEESWSYGFFW